MFFLLLVYMQNSKFAMLIWNCICRPATIVQLSPSDVLCCAVAQRRFVFDTVAHVFSIACVHAKF